MSIKETLQSLAARGFARAYRPPGLSVITFHRFGKPTGITQDHVHHHLKFMAQHFKMTVPRRFNAELESGVSRIGMATVDDCHRDIYDYLYPAARALNVPFVICVPTDFFFRRQWLWFDLLYWMLERAPARAELTLAGRKLVLASKADIAFLKRALKSCLKPERDNLLLDISHQLALVCPAEPKDGYEAVNESQMREMLQSGLVEICAHTVSHTIATVLAPQDLESELAQSKNELETFAGEEIPSFCYPNGEAGDFSDATTRAIKKTGFRLAFTSVDGDNPIRSDPFLIKRLHAHPAKSVFEQEVSGLVKLRNFITGRREAQAPSNTKRFP